jgi:hypothetical protein
VRSADPEVLDAALREISARFAEIKNPGAYLRRLLAGGRAVPARPAVVPVQVPVPVPRAAPVVAPAVVEEPAGRSLPDVSGERLVALYAQLPAGARDDVDRALGRMAAVAGSGWCHVPDLSRSRRLYLVGVLERLGLLPDAR